MTCIGIALIFWLLVKLSKNFESEKEFQIVYNLPDSKTLVDAPPKTIKATLYGIGWDLISYYFKSNSNTIHFNLEDVSRYTINNKLLLNAISEKIKANAIEVTNVDHDFILIELENKIEKKVPVLLNVDLDFASQYFLRDSAKLIPDSITISGPSTKIESISSWSTEKREIKNLKTSCTLDLNLMKANDPQINLHPQKIQLELVIEQFTQKTLFLPIHIKNAPDSIRIFPSKIKLNCIVGLSRYEQLNPSDFVAEVDLKNSSTPSQNNTAAIRLVISPDYIQNANFSPKYVEYFILQK